MTLLPGDKLAEARRGEALVSAADGFTDREKAAAARRRARASGRVVVESKRPLVRR
jgi:hypothetical protein